jgi:4-amino-4-deoxy-L-arabinose transferase-like glycosyltransferase
MMEQTSHLGKGWYLSIVSAGILGFGMLLKKKPLRETGELGLYALIIAGIVVQVVKGLIGRPRPRLVDEGITHWAPFLTGGAHGYDSFPSGHATSAFALALVFARFFPQGRILFYAVASFISLSRLFVGAHFLSDVVGGIYLGLACGMVICWSSPRILQFTSRIAEKRKDLLAAGAVLILAGVLFFNQLGAVGLFDLDEAVFSEASREMIETGNFITPLYNYAYRYDKPILFYWLMSSSFSVFGINEFAARFWSALAGCGLVLATFLFARAVGSLRSAVISAAILATSIEMLVLAHAAITDMVLTFFISSSLFCFFMAAQEPALGPAPAWKAKWALWGWAAVAAAVLTKGPIGILLPMGIIFLFLWTTGRLRQAVRLLAVGPGILLFCGLTLPWYIAESVMTRGEFLQAFFLKHNVVRYLSVNSGHRGPVFYYLLVIAVGLFPWSGFLPAAAWSAWKLRKNDLPLFILLWIGVILIFFSFSSTKLPNYAAPLFPALCLLVGGWWDRMLSEGDQARGVRLSAGFGLGLSLLLTAALASVPFVFKMVQARLSSVPYITEPLDLGILPFLLAGSAALTAVGYFLFLKKERRLESFGVQVTSMVLFSLILFEGLLPRVGRYIQEPLRHLTRLAVERAAPQEPVVVLGLNNPSILFYARRPATIIGGDDVTRLRTHLNRPDPVYILTKASLAERYKEVSGFYPIERRGGYVLVSNRPVEGSP